MREPIRIRTIEAGDESGLAEARAFAASFDHALQENHLPVHILCRGDRPFAFFQHLRLVTAFPSFHTDPSVCSPRDTYEGACLMREKSIEWFGGCVTEVSAEPDTHFTPRVMRKLGLAPRNSRLYQTI